MAKLSSNPGSSTKRQRRTLVIEGRRRGMDLAEIREAVGGSISELSAVRASDYIRRFTGRDLPHEPGCKPSPYAGRKKRPGVTRMISDDQVQQIARLGLLYFDGDAPAFVAWFARNYKVPFRQCISLKALHDLIRGLGSAERAGQVIYALKEMHKR